MSQKSKTSVATVEHICVVLASLQNSTRVCTVPHYWVVAQWGNKNLRQHSSEFSNFYGTPFSQHVFC